MHRIRLHGPWFVRLIQKGNSSDGHSTILANDQNPIPADGVLDEPVSMGTICQLEESIQLPQDWDRWQRTNPLGPDQVYELTRAFGKPTGLVTGQEVWLVLVGQLTCEVWLNGFRLTTDPMSEPDSSSARQFRFPIAAQLLARNSLRLLIDNENSVQRPAGVLQSVYLEIDEP